jgi:CRISPR-associated protein Cas1
MKKSYYLFNPGRLQRVDNSLKFIPIEEDENGEWKKDGQPQFLPVENISDFFVFGSLHANSALFNFLGKMDIALHFFDFYGNYTGSFMPKDALLAGKMILAQTAHYQDKKKRIHIARKFIEGAAFNMKLNLQYYKRKGRNLQHTIELIDKYIDAIPQTNAVDELMGLEGNIRQAYYDAFDLIINDFDMNGRSKQPPKNEVNTLISFGNSLCYTVCLRAIHQTQLNPTISYLHSPGERRYSLSLDIAEIFKPLIVDRLIFKVLNKKEIQSKHFDRNMNKCILNESGRQIFSRAFDEKLLETIKHRSLNKHVSFKHLIKLECYKLTKHLLGIEEYKPLKMYW